jgi:hypothetical protein
MFELGLTNPEYNGYKQWNKLINKIKSIWVQVKKQQQL